MVAGVRRRRPQSLPHAEVPPSFFWGTEEVIKPSACPSCGGHSPFCRTCRTVTPEFDARSNKTLLGIRNLQAGSIAGHLRSPRSAKPYGGDQYGGDQGRISPVTMPSSIRGPSAPQAISTSPRSETAGALAPLGSGVVPGTQINVPAEARPGDKLVLTRVHQVDGTGVFETSDWHCSVMDGQASGQTPGPTIPPSPPSITEVSPRDGDRRQDVDRAAVERLKQERQQFLEWGESLLKEVKLLEQEKASHENRCTELERLVRQGAAQSGAAVAAAEENDDLRKQLSAYAVEIDVLREERDRLRAEIMQAHHVAQQLCNERDERLAVGGSVHQPFYVTALPQPQPAGEVTTDFEASTLLASLQTALTSPLPDEALALSIRSERSFPGVAGPEVHEASAEPEVPSFGQDIACKQDPGDRRDLLDCMSKLKQALATLQEDYVDQTRSFQSFVANVRVQQREASSDMQAARQEFADHHGLSLSTLNSSKADAAAAGQVASQKLERAELEKAHTMGQLDLTKATHSELQDQATELEAELRRHQDMLAQQSMQLEKQNAPIRKRNDNRAERLRKPIALRVLERCLRLNIAFELASCKQGFILEKVHSHDPRGASIPGTSSLRRGSYEPRYVALFATEMQVKWMVPSKGSSDKTSNDYRLEKRAELSLEAKEKLVVQQLTAFPDVHPLCKEGVMSKNAHGLNLWEVVRIDFGIMNRACVISNKDPWQCFSLCTIVRSYDFVCPDEACAQCWVLAISRLCPWASGAIRSREVFIVRKGWCKVESHCQQNEMTIPSAALQAIHAAMGAASQQDAESDL